MLYDLDDEAPRVRPAGHGMVRSRDGRHPPGFVAMLRELIEERLGLRQERRPLVIMSRATMFVRTTAAFRQPVRHQQPLVRCNIMSHDPPSSASLECASVLSIDEAEIRKHGPGRLPAVGRRQWRAERRLKGRGIDFRTTDAQAAEAAYAAMTEAEFEAINGRQDWANWRTIPALAPGLLPNRPLRIVDLGCGTGGSTRVLAFYASADSKITAY